MISAFGPRAEAYAARMAALDAVVTDFDAASMGLAYLECVRRRERGESFYGMVLLTEPRAAAILGIAPQVVQQLPDYDACRATLDELGSGALAVSGKRVEDLWGNDETLAQMTREFAGLSNGMLVRSFAEAARLGTIVPRLHATEPVVVEPEVPAVEPVPGGRPAVLIWAPNNLASYVTWYAQALGEFFGDVVCVSGGGSVPPRSRARFLTPLDPALPAVLASVQCVLCADPDDPGAAVAFARRGFGVAAPRQSGAHEYVRDIVSFPLAKQRDIELAVKIAITRPASVRATPQPPRAPSAPAFALPAARLPLVSVMVGTYNRPDDLERCLQALALHTYPRIEAVVLNDAGENVDHIVNRFSFARPVNLPVNGGVLKLIAEGFKHLRGEYVQFLADDDTLYPDHITRMMSAILRSGAAVAHGNTLIRYQERLDDGSLRVSGFNGLTFNDSATPTEALVATPIAGQSLIYRRDIFDEIGYFRQDTGLADQEFQLRAANRYVFAYVDQLTAEWRVRGGENFSSKSDAAAELRNVFAIHPVAGRPAVEEWRRQAVAAAEERPKGFIFTPTVQVNRA